MRRNWVVALSAMSLVGLTSADASAQTCRAFESGTLVGNITDPGLDEASGLAASWTNAGLFWSHNDSGDVARVFILDATGATVSEVALNGAQARDYEDIAIGPCGPADTTPCVWVGDIGDNDAVRPNITLYRFEEPDFGGSPPSTTSVTPTAIDVTYTGGARNAETLMVHPVDGRLFIVDKTTGDPNNLWLVHTDGTPAELVASVNLNELGVVAGRVTGGDFSPDGAEFSIRTYTHVYTFCGEDPVQAFTGAFTSVLSFPLAQSEALTYDRDGQALLTTSEQTQAEQPPFVVMPLQGGVDPMPDMGETPDMNPQPMDADMSVTPTPDASSEDEMREPQVVVHDGSELSGGCCRCAVATRRPQWWSVLIFGAFWFVRRRSFARS